MCRQQGLSAPSFRASGPSTLDFLTFSVLSLAQDSVFTAQGVSLCQPIMRRSLSLSVFRLHRVDHGPSWPLGRFKASLDSAWDLPLHSKAEEASYAVFVVDKMDKWNWGQIV